MRELLQSESGRYRQLFNNFDGLPEHDTPSEASSAAVCSRAGPAGVKNFGKAPDQQRPDDVL